MLESYGTVLVTGGLGFIGQHMVRTLVAMGKRVIVGDYWPDGTSPSVPDGVLLLRMDLRDPAQVRRAMDMVDLVFHIAGNANVTVSITDSRLDFETNALGTFNVLEAARDLGVQKCVYTSSALVYGRPERVPLRESDPPNPLVPYAASKLTAELYVRAFAAAHRLPAVSARLFCVYGPGERPERALVEVQRYLRWHLNRLPVEVVGDMDRKTRDFIHISDVVAGLLVLAERGAAGEVYNLGSGQETSMRELLVAIERATGWPVAVEAAPHLLEDSFRQRADMSKLGALGFAPQVSLEQGIAQLAATLGSHPELPSASVLLRSMSQSKVEQPYA